MFGPSINDPTLGLIRRRWGKWRGAVSLASLPRDLSLVIEIPRKEPVDAYVLRAKNVLIRFNDFQDDLANLLYEDYILYKTIDIDEGGFTERDFEE